MKIHPNSTCNTCSKDCKKYYVGECSFKEETLYSIDACHSIFKRVIKFHLTYDEVIQKKETLESMGYDSIIITDESTGLFTEYRR